MSLIGKKINEFKLEAYHEGEFKTFTDKDFFGTWNALVFYPADFSFVCPTELEDLAYHYEEFQKLGCNVYSSSTDSHFVHMAWHNQSPKINKIKFPMLADPTGSLARDFRVLVEENYQSLRGSFLINPEGVIVAYEVNDMGIGRSAKDLLRKLQAAQYVYINGSEVCPANWTPGEDTLTPGEELVGKL